MVKTTEYLAITLETLEKTAFSAAYVAIRKAYHGTPHKITVNGVDMGRDGNSGGADIIRRLYQGFSTSTAAAKMLYNDAAALYDENPTPQTLETMETAAANYAAAVPNDTDDCIQAAALALWENIAGNDGETATETAFMDAVRAVHRYIYQQDKNTSTKVRRRYNSKGELLAIDDYQYIKYPHISINQYAGEDENGGAIFEIVDVNDELSKYIQGQRNNDTINDVLALLTATQKRILQYVAIGYTYETIAARLNITQSTVRQHMHRIRQKAATVER